MNPREGSVRVGAKAGRFDMPECVAPVLVMTVGTGDIDRLEESLFAPLSV